MIQQTANAWGKGKEGRWKVSVGLVLERKDSISYILLATENYMP
jgi:hypothetical protein